MVCLQWIQSSPEKWKLFVARRIQEIQSVSDRDEWRFCRGKENPADLLTKGKTVEELIDSKLWWHGPEWLKEESLWSPSLNGNSIIEVSEERRPEVVQFK